MKKLVKKKELIEQIEKLGTVPWEDDERVFLIPKDAVLLSVNSPFCTLSPAELAGILKEKLKGDSWVLEELKKALIYRTSDSLNRGFDSGYNQAIKLISDTIEALEKGQAEGTELSKIEKLEGEISDE